MKGLEISKILYERARNDFLTRYEEDQLAIGLVGYGSECFGFDDEISKDHDFKSGFCIWLDKEYYDFVKDDMQKDFEVFLLKQSDLSSNIVIREKRIGVFEIDTFYKNILQNDIPLNDLDFRFLKMSTLANATNGEVFVDNLGKFTSIRKKLMHYPKDIKLKQIAKNIAIASQAGQYNYYRILNRNPMIGEEYTILSVFVNHIIESIYLLNDVHMPFYKWSFKKIESLEKLSHLQRSLNGIYMKNNINILIEYICSEIIKELKIQNLSDLEDDFLINHSEIVHSKINDKYLRYTNIMED